ncbi:MAG: HEPN domain-containing protein [Syntrophaceae bacterium]|nr:HEPN domain-containing protein [Syntrophaceae bacterium]
MDLKRLEAQGYIEKANFSSGQIKSNLNRAQLDLRTAKANLKMDEEWAYTIAYHAMLRAGRAFMFAPGYRPRGKDQHKTVVEFCSESLGKDFHHLTIRFNRMRLKRHDFIYEPERPIPRTEAEKSLESAEEFVKEIVLRIEKMNPQKRLIS